MGTRIPNTKGIKRTRAKDLLVSVTAEELHFAHVAAHGAASFRTPTKSFLGNYMEAVEAGQIDRDASVWVPKDIPENRAAFAIMDAFPERTPEGEEKRKSLGWRVIYALQAVVEDARATPFMKTEDGQDMIARPLTQAVAETPMELGREIPLDAIFEKAMQIVAAGPK